MKRIDWQKLEEKKAKAEVRLAELKSMIQDEKFEEFGNTIAWGRAVMDQVELAIFGYSQGPFSNGMSRV